LQITVSVITDDPVKADALSTALFVMGADAAMNYITNSSNIDAVLVTENMEVYLSSGIENIFNPADGITIS